MLNKIISGKHFFSISELSEATKIPTYQIRNWENRHNFPHTKEDSNKFYSNNEYNAFILATDKYKKGLKDISKIKNSYKDILNKFDELEENLTKLKANKVNKLLESLYNFDINSANKLYYEITLDLNKLDVINYIFLEALKKIGNNWHQKKISITEEHYASGFIRDKLREFLKEDFTSSDYKNIALATTEFEKHEGGLLAISAGLRTIGIGITYLGIEIPVKDLINTLNKKNIKFLALSYTYEENYLRDLKEFINFNGTIFIGGLIAFSQNLKALENTIIMNSAFINTIRDISSYIKK